MGLIADHDGDLALLLSPGNQRGGIGHRHIADVHEDRDGLKATGRSGDGTTEFGTPNDPTDRQHYGRRSSRVHQRETTRQHRHGREAEFELYGDCAAETSGQSA